jgi:hypothetical protein
MCLKARTSNFEISTSNFEQASRIRKAALGFTVQRSMLYRLNDEHSPFLAVVLSRANARYKYFDQFFRFIQNGLHFFGWLNKGYPVNEL